MNSQKISPADWKLCYGQEAEPVFRAVPEAQNEQFNSLEVTPLGKQNAKRIEPEAEVHLFDSLTEISDLCHLTRYVIVSAHVTIPFVFNFLQSHIQGRLKNFKVNQRSKSIITYLFDQTLFSQLRLQVFSHGEKCGISLDVLEGSAQDAVSHFWSELQQEMLNKELLIHSEDEDESESCEDDSWFEDSDDESEPLDLNQAKFVQLDEDPNLWQHMLNDLQDPNFMERTLLLLAWNCQLASNWEAISENGKAQQLFDTIITCLIHTATDFCLPTVRSASLLVCQLVKTGGITVNERQFQVLVNIIVQWTLSNNGTHDKITQSEEIAELLSSHLPQFSSLAVKTQSLESLEQVCLQTKFAGVRENIQPLLKAC